MSYILDALKRADTERERGVVPGLYARQVINPSRTAGRTARARLWVGLAITALVLGLVATGLYFLRPTAEPTPARSASMAGSQSTQSPAVPAPAPPSVNEPAPAVFAAVIQQRPQVAPPSAQAQLEPTPVVPSVPPPIATPKTARATATPTSTTTSAAPTPTAAAQAQPATPLLSELPEELRRQIPALAITGVVFSDAPGQRLLLVNNQVMTQGSQITAELTLIEVGAKSSVFSFRGNRFRLSH